MDPASKLRKSANVSRHFSNCDSRVSVVLLVLIMILGSAGGNAQWVQVNSGLKDLTVNALATIDTTVFAGTAKGLFRSTNAGESWSFIGPDTTAVQLIATDQENLLIQSDTSLFYSSDLGASWVKFKTAAWWATNRNISAIAVKGALALVGTYGSSSGGYVMVFRSSDFGLTWTAQSDPQPYFHNRGAINRICSAGSDWFLAMRDEEYVGDIYRSLDGGNQWTALPRFPSVLGRGVGISDLAVNETSMYATAWFYGGGTVVYRSTNIGTEWDPVLGVGPNGTFYDPTLNDRSVMARVSMLNADSLFRSTNGGTHWKRVTANLAGHKVRCLAMNQSEAYASVSGGGVYRYSLTGAIWITLYDAENWGQPGTNARVALLDTAGTIVDQRQATSDSKVAFDPILDGGGYSYRVYANPAGIWGEQFWGEKTGIEITANDTTRDNFTHNTPYMPSVTVYIDSTNELLPDGAVKAVVPGTRLRIELQIKNPGYEGARSVSAYGVVRFDRDRVAPFDLTVSSGLLALDPDSTGKAVFTCNAPALPGPYAMSVATYASSNRYPVALTDGSGWHDPAFSVISAPSLVYPSNSMSSLPTGLTFRWRRSEGATRYRFVLAENVSLDSIRVVNDSTIVDTVYAISGLKLNTRYFWQVETISNTVPGGPSPVWTFRTAQIVPGHPEPVHPLQNAVLNTMVVGFVWRKASPDVERYWHELATDSAFTFAIVDTTIADTTFLRTGIPDGNYWWRVRAFNAAGWGVFSDPRRFSISLTGIMPDRMVPEEFSLAQNFPNPFNPSTMIRFGVPVSSHVTITLFNALGQQVETLVDRVMDAGYHEVKCDAERLPSGVYLYRMKAGEFVSTRRLVVVK